MAYYKVITTDLNNIDSMLALEQAYKNSKTIICDGFTALCKAIGYKPTLPVFIKSKEPFTEVRGNTEYTISIARFNDVARYNRAHGIEEIITND